MNKLNVVSEKITTQSKKKIKKILAIAAGKGGVGKSSVTVQLAHALKSKGFKVGVLDADIYGPSIGQMLPEGMPPTEMLENPDVFHPGLSSGIAYISVAHFRDNASIVRAPIANQIIEQFLHSIDWGELDYLLIDFPPGTGDVQLTMMQKAMIDAAIVITTPQIISTLDVRKAIQLFDKMLIPVMGILENMSYLIHAKTGEKECVFGEGGAKRLSDEFSLPILGQVPLDPALSQAADQGASLFDEFKEAPSTGVFSTVCDQIIERCEQLKSPQMQIERIDAQHVELRSGDKTCVVRANQLQTLCPCAKCEGTKSSLSDVSLLEFSPIGRYAIKFNFSSGCSQGIYPFTLLEECCLK